MNTQTSQVNTAQSNFALKHQMVSLIPAHQKLEGGAQSIRMLEGSRISDKPLTASKNGLETICGCSGETAAN